jgi:hypothetical protein
MTQWEIEGDEFVNCNCSYGCPCQFNARPSKGHCEAMGAIAIRKGRHGDVPLDGLKIAFAFQWPGAIHEGGGTCQPIVDEKADAKQREALLKILSGADTEPGATMFNVFASTMDKVLDPIVARIHFSVDVEGRKGMIDVDGIMEMRGQPILNPVTQREHRARIDLPHGFEYSIAEIGRGSSRIRGKLPIELHDSYGQFAHLHLTNSGPVREKQAA